MLKVEYLVALIFKINEKINKLEKMFAEQRRKISKIYDEERAYKFGRKIGRKSGGENKSATILAEQIALEESSINDLKAMKTRLQTELRNQLGDFTPEDIAKALQS